MTAKEMFDYVKIGDVINGKFVVTKILRVALFSKDKRFSTAIRTNNDETVRIETMSRNGIQYFKRGKHGGYRKSDRTKDRRYKENRWKLSYLKMEIK